MQFSFPSIQTQSDPIHYCSAIRINFFLLCKQTNIVRMRIVFYHFCSPACSRKCPGLILFGFIGRVFFAKVKLNYNGKDATRNEHKSVSTFIWYRRDQWMNHITLLHYHVDERVSCITMICIFLLRNRVDVILFY